MVAMRLLSAGSLRARYLVLPGQGLRSGMMFVPGPLLSRGSEFERRGSLLQRDSAVKLPSRIFVSKKSNFAGFLESAGRANFAESIAYGPCCGDHRGV